MKYSKYLILIAFFISLVLSENKNNKQPKSWLEEEKDVAKQLLESFIGQDNNEQGLENLEIETKPQNLRSADGVYRISLCFFKDDEGQEKMNKNQPGNDGNTNLPVPRRPNTDNVPRADNDNDNDNKNYSEICALKPETGMCRASFTAYYYQPARGDCFPFVYGGCGGNENKFRSKEDCLEKCKNKGIIFPQRSRLF